jgi:hypothetical protein
MYMINGPETRRTPPEFQDRLTRLFGKNEFGDPLFKIVWGQTQLIRMGNVWRDAFGNERVEYRDRYQCHGQPCWVIMRWKPPSDYGSPEIYYLTTHDSLTNLYITGEYPWRGRYEVVQPLVFREVIDGKMHVEHLPLTHYLIDVLIPMMRQFQALSYEEQQAAKMACKAAEDARTTQEVSEAMMANMPSYWGPVSFARGGCKTSLLAKKEEQITAALNRVKVRGRQPVFRPSGVKVMNRPRPIAYR